MKCVKKQRVRDIMPVSKEALFERYKKLKSEGVSITLMELKKQMETEEQTSSAEPVQSGNETVRNGFSALNQASFVQCSMQTDTNTQVQNGFQTSQPQTFSSGIQQGNIPQNNENKTPEPSDYSNSRGVAWQTSYYNNNSQSPAAVSGQPQAAQISCEQTVNTYSNNFTTTFGGSSAQSVGKNINSEQNTQTKYQQNFTPVEKPVRNKYCLIGYPLGHSLSTYIHEAGFKSLGADCSYELLETPPEQLVDRIKYLKYHGFAGFNVTIPLKLPVTMFLDEIDVSADLIGAVNTVVINDDLSLKGYNTDVLGFKNAIPQDITLAGKTIAILGTGGAARAAITALAQEQVKSIQIYTRNVPNAIELLKYLREKFPQIEFNAFQIERIRDLSNTDILVNTTPIGMQGRAADMTPVEETELKTLPQGAIVYDVIYNPRKTILLKLAQKNGYRTINGMDMLIHQAVAAEQIWFGKTPDFKDMKIAALENI